MCPSIEYNIDISMIHHSIVPDSVLFISLGIKDCDVQVPHSTHCVRHHLITPKLLVQEVPTVRLVGQWTFECGSFLIQAIVGFQCSMFVVRRPSGGSGLTRQPLACENIKLDRWGHHKHLYASPPELS